MLKHPNIPNYLEAFDLIHPQPDVGEVHGHDDYHEHDKPISKKWKWATVLGNLAIGAAEMITGKLDSMSLFGDGLHNFTDAAAYNMQADNILKAKKYSEEKLRRRRKISHTLICLGSLAVSVKAGVDLAMDVDKEPHNFGVVAAGASVALTSGLYYGLERGISKSKKAGAKQNPAKIRDMRQHFLSVDFPSSFIALAGSTQFLGVKEQIFGLLSGAFGMWAFRPTKNNLDHDHSHGHGHGHSHHHEHNHSDKKLKWHEKLSSHIWATGSYAAGRMKNWIEKPGFEHKKSRPILKKIALGITAVAGVAASQWLGRELFSNEIVEAGTAHMQMPPAAPAPPAPVFEQHIAVSPESTAVYNQAARTVMPGEGFEQMIKHDMGLHYSQEVLKNAGEALSNMEYADGTSISYFDYNADEWRLHLPSDGLLMPEAALNAVRAEV